MRAQKSSSHAQRKEPISERILRDIEGRILSGVWSPGQRIPYEHELMMEYSCSRMTVNKAMSALSARGLITRRRRAGSFVAAPQIEQSIFEIRDFAKEAELNGVSYRYELIDRKITAVREGEEDRGHLAPGTEVVMLRGLHWFKDVPVALEVRLISLAAVPKARNETFQSVAPGTWLLSEIPWTEAEHLIRAVSADAKTAKLLQITKGAACLCLERHTWKSGTPITEVRLLHPGERYHFIGRFQPMSHGTRYSAPSKKRLAGNVVAPIVR